MKNKNNDAYLIASVLKKNGFEAFYAGGCVRDFLAKNNLKIMILQPQLYPMKLKNYLIEQIVLEKNSGL